MSQEAIVFDSVLFWDMAGERHLPIEGHRGFRDASMVPLPGDRVTFESDDDQFVVVYREFTIRNGICYIIVNVQPVTRDK